MALKSRQLMIPNGFQFLQPETGWRPRRWSSFDSIVAQVIAHRKGNPHLIQKNGWSIDPNTVAIEVDNYNTAVCRQMGWNQFIDNPFPTPFQQSPQQRSTPPGRLALAAGAVSLVEWIASGAEAVPAEQANSRASTCVQCPLNNQGDWTAFFTVPIQNAIREQLQRRKAMALSTPFDEQIGVCDACLCPLKLKLHMPIQDILKRMPADAKAALHPACWITAEEKNVK